METGEGTAGDEAAAVSGSAVGDAERVGTSVTRVLACLGTCGPTE